jgi:hypothetical protein
MGVQTDKLIDRRKNMTRVMGAFRNNAKTPRKEGLRGKQKEREKREKYGKEATKRKARRSNK